MPYSFHSDKKRYFEMQEAVTKSHIIPFIDQSLPHFNWEQSEVLEVGCGEAGVLKACLDQGAKYCLGIELSEGRVRLAQDFLKPYISQKRVSIISSNILHGSTQTELREKFDLIILKDVIEHLHDRNKVIEILKYFLKPQGVIFFAFPPWQMPFGGHQQGAKNKILSITPYIHLLPRSLYKLALKLFGESDSMISAFLEIQDTKISIEDFENLCNYHSLEKINQRHYLINPIYKYKFGLEPMEQYRLLTKARYFRNYFTSCVYYTVKPASR